MASRCRELALFNLAIDSKLRACDLVQLRVRDVCHGQIMASRALVLQQKTHRPVQFEITEPTREALLAWITSSKLKSEDFLFPSRIRSSPHLSTRQYARIVDSWVERLGLNVASYGTHTLRLTKATLIYRRTKNLRAVQPLFGHTKTFGASGETLSPSRTSLSRAVRAPQTVAAGSPRTAGPSCCVHPYRHLLRVDPRR